MVVGGSPPGALLVLGGDAIGGGSSRGLQWGRGSRFHRFPRVGVRLGGGGGSRFPYEDQRTFRVRSVHLRVSPEGSMKNATPSTPPCHPWSSELAVKAAVLATPPPHLPEKPLRGISFAAVALRKTATP